MGSDVDPHEDTSAEPVPAARPQGLAAGSVIGGYRLIEVLGQGGMGVVWAAHDPTLDRRVAIKVLKRGDAVPSLRKRLLREARAMARLKHPNVLTVYEVGTEGDRDYIAMELVDGGSLDEWLDRAPMRDDVTRAVLAAGRGLAAAHAAGLVHRDFKPHNVLRSREGRVLVTDFGLARGMGEESHDPAAVSADGTRAVSATSNDSVLDSPLTQTGALIGTPAYMAPEQFLGAAPDPRTDQFAFCVTAWQALTGSRPYTGSTIDELRRAASAGVSPALKVDLAPEVRAALARGLDPDPAKRWPSLDDLLDVLDHAVRPRRPRWLVPAIAVGLIGIVAGAVLIARRQPASAAVADGCAPGEDPFATAWSPEARTALSKSLSARGVDLSEAAFARVADPMDAYRARWTQAFASACKAPERVGEKQRACLVGARDQAAALAIVLRDGPAPLYAKIDLHGMLPDLGRCAGDNPTVPPHPPEDPMLRDKVIHLFARAIAIGGAPDFEQQYPALEQEAAAVGWAPMLPVIELGVGNELLRRGRYRAARAELAKVLAAPPDTRDAGTVAIARIGMLDAAMEELEQPATDAKPGELHPELARLLTYAHSEVKAAGNEPTLIAGLAGTETRAYWALAQLGRYPKAYDEALARGRKAAELYREAGDVRRSVRMTAIVAQILVERGGPTSLDDAMFAARTADEALTAAQLAPMPDLDVTRAYIEQARGNYALAEELYARVAGAPPPPHGPLHTGTVVNRDGKPIAGARVVAWSGELVGDPHAAVTDPAALTGEVVETAADGTFSIHAAPTDALIAEATDLRSLPVLAGTAPSRLALRPTVVYAGTTDADLSNVFAFARWHAGDNTFEIRAPAGRDRSFHIAGLPEPPPEDGLYGDAGQAERRVIAAPGATALHWPTGEVFEVIVRGAVASPLVHAGPPQDRAIATLRPVGADNTDAGRAVYEPGDLHAVIAGNPPTVEVCIARPTREECRTARAEPGHSLGVTPVIFPDDGGTPAR